MNLPHNFSEQGRVTRRRILRTGGAFAGRFLLGQAIPESLYAAWPPQSLQAPAGADPLVAARAEFGKVPIASTPLADHLTMLSGPGGNVVVSSGQDGKLLVDTFVSSAWDRVQAALADIGNAPLKYVIDTHWHWDHTDNNANFARAGATLIAHENTRKRLRETHDLDVLNFHFDPASDDAVPQHTFAGSYQMHFNDEHLTLGHLAPAHTDSDIYVHFQRANVLHMGDVFFNGMYCYLDRGTGGSIAGVIAASTRMLAMIDSNTKVIPGHGPLGTKAALKDYRDMLQTADARLKKLKAGGKSLEQVIAANPLADLDPVWGKGFFNPADFLRIVYPTV